MKLFNLHTHCTYCDGSSEPEAYVKEAIRQGFHTLGFSSHSPLPFKNRFAITNDEKLKEYADEIRSLKSKYSNQINIYLGLEIDFIPGISKPFRYFTNLAGLDYTIGGVHLIKRENRDELWFTDGPVQEIYDNGMKLLFGDDVQTAVIAYWNQVREMISTQKPDVVAHLDKIKMHNKNRFFTEDEAWYEEQVDETLALIAEAGTIVEVNTRGIYKGRSDELFPGVKALKKIHRLGIPIILSSDAHRPEELSGYFREALEILDGIGFKKLMLFSEKGWTETPVKS
ncbi:MAG: histidinol-phosphatase [Bacteroidales bacterium]|nr:histidinol-phosphatase [Bacteroidales bacterium]